jgi:hypothetical protein
MLAVKYALFALFSTLVNLFVQFLYFQVYSGSLSLYPALAVGTLAGLG